MQSESIFPEPILRLVAADVPLDGVQARLSQAATHQILFMEFSKDADDLPLLFGPLDPYFSSTILMEIVEAK